jgi:hypothetical protein
MMGPLAPRRKTAMPGKLLTREEAADMCRVSLGTFDARVRPHLRVKRVGVRVLIPESEIERWIEAEEVEAEQNRGLLPETGTRSDRRPSEESGTFASAKPLVAESEAPEPRILAKLKKLEIACTLKLSPNRLRSALREPHECPNESGSLPEALSAQASGTSRKQ